MRILLFILLFPSVCFAYEYKYINKLEQFGSVDYDLVISDKGQEVGRFHKSFPGKVTQKDLDNEAALEIENIINPPPPPVVIKSEVEELREKVIILEKELISVKIAR